MTEMKVVPVEKLARDIRNALEEFNDDNLPVVVCVQKLVRSADPLSAIPEPTGRLEKIVRKATDQIIFHKLRATLSQAQIEVIITEALKAKAMLSAVEPAPDGLVEDEVVLSNLESWRCSLHPVEQRLAICEGAVIFERKVIKNLRRQLAAALTSRAAVLEEAAKYLVWSNEHGCFWAANRCGYRAMVEEAGRYTLEEATDICRIRSWDAGRPPETILPVAAIRAAKGE